MAEEFALLTAGMRDRSNGPEHNCPGTSLAQAESCEWQLHKSMHVSFHSTDNGWPY